MTQNRKRGRNMVEDEVESPLSKRINNLHINNSSLLLDNHNLAQPNISQWTGSLPQPQQQQATLFQDQDDTMGFNPPLTPTESLPSINFESTRYSPVLNETENPYYFHKNKLLFEMHIERMQRNPHSF